MPETALLAFQHVGQRLQRALVGAGDDAATAAVIEQRIDRFLQHALFVAHDDIRRAQLDQALQAVVAVDDAAIEIVQIRRREAAAIERHQRAQLWRDDRHHVEHHPFRLGVRFHEGFDQLQALHQLLALDFGVCGAQVVPHFHLFVGKVQFLQHALQGFRADQRLEAFLPILILRVDVLFLGHQLLHLQRRHARLDDDERLEVEDLFQLLQRHVEHQARAARQRLHQPDMGNRGGELDVAHPLAPHLLQRNLDAAFLADDALELHALVLAAQAFVILDRPENAGAEQAIALRLERAVVDRLRLLDLAERPRANLFRTRNRDLDLVETLGSGRLTENLHQVVHRSNSRWGTRLIFPVGKTS